jgi:hypothetical protein
MASTAFGDAKASRSCRGAIGKSLAKLAKGGFKTADKCHKAADKAGEASGQCNSVATFDPDAKYVAAKTKATTSISVKCLSGDPVLTNYDGLSVNGAVFPRLDESIGGNTLIVEGSTDLDGDKAKTKCLEATGKARTSIVAEILKGSTKCQATLDKTATSFGPLDSSCVNEAPKGSAKAIVKIPAACGALNGSDVGSCDPLPACVIDAGKAAGQLLAQEFYQSITGPSACGNSIVDPGEQCDGGPACNSGCELTYDTCAPSLPGFRVVHVRITSPTALAGTRVDVNYPIFQMSIPGLGNSSLVTPRFHKLVSGGDATLNDTDNVLIALLTNATNFIPAGTDVPVFDLDFNRCVQIDQNICTRNPNVVGCHEVNRCTCTVAADCGPGGAPACALINGSTMGKQCTGGSQTKVNCTSDTQCAGGQTCQPDPQGEFNPPICAINHFPQAGNHQPPFLVPTEVGLCDGTDLGPPGGCPSGNDCRSQAEIVGCTVSNPTDQDGNPVFGVGCSIVIDEPAAVTTTTSTIATTTTSIATTSTTDTTTSTTETTTSTTDTTTSTTL